MDYVSQMLSGPGRIRFVLQPVIAFILGIRDGVRDARAGEPPYVLALFKLSGRKVRVKQGLRQIALPLAVGVGLSLTFQYVIRRTAHLIPALLFGTVFIAVPYMVARALANRMWRPVLRRRAAARGHAG